MKVIRCYVLAVTLSSCVSTPSPITLPIAKESSSQGLVLQGNQFAKDGLLREASESYKKAIARDSTNATARRNLGIVLLKAGDANGAIQNLEQSLSQYDDNFEANFYLGEAYRAQDKYAEAIFRYKKALKLQDGEPRALKSLAWSYYKIRFYSEAIVTVQRIQKTDPDDEQAPIIMARILLKLKRENEAQLALKNNMSRIKTSAIPYYQSALAEVYAAQGKSNEAIDLWQKALKSQPMLASALLGLGKTLLENGQGKDAVDYLVRSVHLKPKMYEGHYWLGRALEDSDPAKSMRYFNYFRKFGANDPEYLDLIQDTKKRSASLQQRLK